MTELLQFVLVQFVLMLNILDILQLVLMLEFVLVLGLTHVLTPALPLFLAWTFLVVV